MHTKTTGFWRQALGALVIGLLATAAQAKPPSGGGWVKHENLSPVRGADGKMHTATCSGFPGTDPAFSFWTKKGKSKNLAVYFEGGGACWDSFTCGFPIKENLPPNVPQLFVPAIDANTLPANYDGLFRSDNRANPVKDWTMVYIPYCTGDLHIGSASVPYVNTSSPFLPPGPFTIEHRGFDNFMVVLDWMKKNIDKPKTILVAGSSAGGYGATANFPWIQRSFRDADMHVIADASQGVTAPAFDTGNPGRSSWNIQLAPWVFGNDPSAIAGPELMRTAALALPKVRIGQFTTTFDTVQIGFYGVMKQLYQYPGTCFNENNVNLTTAIDWNNQMVSTLQSDDAATRNFRYYLAQGDYHTLLRSPLFYTEASGGVAFSKWLDDMLEGRREGHGHGDRHHDRGWQNAVCTDCLVPATCP